MPAIDADRLASVMAEHKPGVSTVGLDKFERLHSDYFDEERVDAGWISCAAM